jgi:hypothetical protein
LPFIDIPTKSFQIVQGESLKTIELSSAAKRTFCGECGTPVTMVYEFDADREYYLVLFGAVAGFV